MCGLKNLSGTKHTPITLTHQFSLNFAAQISSIATKTTLCFCNDYEL